MIPFDTNVAYIQIENGDTFGDIDIIASAREAHTDLQGAFYQLEENNPINLVRYFTVQTIKETCLMQMNIQNLHRMSK